MNATQIAPADESRDDPVQRGLSADIHFLGDLLGRTIQRLAGAEAYALVEEIRAATKTLRTQHSVAEARALRDRLEALDLDALRTLTRAFGLYFDLINLAEMRARLRSIRARAASPEPVAESVEAGLRQLRERGIDAGQIMTLLKGGLIAPVFTAHPSESRRRTIREKLDTICRGLDRIEYTQLLPGERERELAGIAEEVETFWLTELVRAERPSVLDEVDQGLGVVAPTLFDVVPWIYRQIEASLKRTYPDQPTRVPSFLRFGGWIGGDRDGNPNVTHTVTAQTIRMQQESVLTRYLEYIQELGRRLSHSATQIEATPQLKESLERDADLLVDDHVRMVREPYRAKCRAIETRLRLTLSHVRRLKLHWPAEEIETPAGIYAMRTDLLTDLELLRAALAAAGASESKCGPLHDLIRLVEVFGLHLLTLDIRQHGARHASAIDEIFAWSGVCPAYLKLKASERFDLLVSALQQKRPVLPAYLPFSAETEEVIQTFRTVSAILEQQCPEAVENYIISGCTEPGHLLEVLLLAREARLFRPEDGISKLNIVPLFEDMESLKGASTIMQRLLHLPIYRKHLELRGNVQEVMIGYSDSNKETGFLQSAWALYKAQCVLAETARRSNIRVQIFHGRGGAIGRGGGPANRAILAQPNHTVDGRLRFTEQGEMMADRYGSSGVAERHLEQIVNAVLRTSFATDEERPSPVWERLLERVAERAVRHYRTLVYQTPEFLTYFEQATPIAEIGQLKIASRPARRASPDAKPAGIDQLRAIPWVFSWMQSRHTLPGWYGLGSAVLEYLQEHPEDREVLMSMYERWPFWRTLIDNAQMILAKADITIARLYADLVTDQEIATRVFQQISTEYERTVEVIRLITGQAELLDNIPTLKRSIQRRNPYVDALSFVQLVLLRRLRGGAEPRGEMLSAVLESISGIASGLKNTG